MNPITIYYIIPNIHSPKIKIVEAIRHLRRGKLLEYIIAKRKSLDKAGGGTKVQLQHIHALNKAGYKAVALKMGEYEGRVFGFDIPYVRYSQVRHKITANDIVVSTEFAPYDGLLFEKAKKVVFMQNWVNLRRRLKPKDRNLSYIDIGYDHVITCGEYSTRMVSKEMGIDATTITNGIDTSLFYPKEELRVKNRVLVLSRKNYDDFLKIKELIDIDVDFRVVDGVTQEEMISEMRAADIFLSTGYPEGFGLPPLEAMACGCAVIGFTGGGASEYMIHNQTALVADDGDVNSLAIHLSEILTNEVLKERLREEGIKIAKGYDLSKMEDKIIDFFRGITS